MPTSIPSETGFRKSLLPRIERATATPKQLAVIDELLAARGKPGGRLANLYAMMVHQPEVARRMGAMGAYCRFHAKPGELVREVTILSACYKLGFAYEVRAHEEIARDRGLPEAELEALRTGAYDRLEGEWGLAARFAASAISGRLPEDLVGEVLTAFGPDGLLDLTAMTAHYCALSLYDRVLRPEPDPAGASLAKPQTEALR